MIRKSGALAKDAFQSFQPVRFLIVGIGNTLFSTLLFMALMWLGMGIASGSALALVAGVLLSYHMQGTLVFRHRSLGAFVRFVLAWTVIYFANLFEIRLMIGWGANRYAAAAMATVPTTIVSFFVQKLFVFAAPLPREGPEVSG